LAQKKLCTFLKYHNPPSPLWLEATQRAQRSVQDSVLHSFSPPQSNHAKNNWLPPTWVHGTIQHNRAIYIYISIQKTELMKNSNFCLFAANGNKRWKFVFLVSKWSMVIDNCCSPNMENPSSRSVGAPPGCEPLPS
jgi:hypothetical protein